MKPKNKKVTTTLRLPKWLDDEITKLASYYGMSKNAFIIMTLKKLRATE